MSRVIRWREIKSQNDFQCYTTISSRSTTDLPTSIVLIFYNKQYDKHKIRASIEYNMLYYSSTKYEQLTVPGETVNNYRVYTVVSITFNNIYLLINLFVCISVGIINPVTTLNVNGLLLYYVNYFLEMEVFVIINIRAYHIFQRLFNNNQQINCFKFKMLPFY